MNSRLGQTAWTALLFAASLHAQQEPKTPDEPKPADAQLPAPAAAPVPPEHPVWSVGPIDFSGLIDGYYSYNANHPASSVNQLRNFDVKANQFSLNMAKFSLSHTADPVGFQLDFGFGRAFDIIHGSEKAPQVFQYIEQAYIALKPARLKGLEVDFGKFVTSAGAEVIETKDNWNYSRSLLFAWAIPYYHFGLRTSFPVGKHFTGGVQLVNGWNNVEDNNSGKTVGVVGAFTSSKATWTNVYYSGPEKADTNKGFRNLYDSTLLLTPSDKVSAYINFDYGRDNNIAAGSSHWSGIATAVRYSPNSRFAFTPRIEYFDDANGFSTGVVQKLWEITMTGEYKMVEGFLARLEYRHDQSNTPFFDRGHTLAASKDQNTVLLGLVAFFGPKR
jgi:hypothetical protein